MWSLPGEVQVPEEGAQRRDQRGEQLRRRRGRQEEAASQEEQEVCGLENGGEIQSVVGPDPTI